MQRQEYCEEKMRSLDDFLAEFVGDEAGLYAEYIESQSKPQSIIRRAGFNCFTITEIAQHDLDCLVKANSSPSRIIASDIQRSSKVSSITIRT